jgi:hypothetical protein
MTATEQRGELLETHRRRLYLDPQYGERWLTERIR